MTIHLDLHQLFNLYSIIIFFEKSTTWAETLHPRFFPQKLDLDLGISLKWVLERWKLFKSKPIQHGWGKSRLNKCDVWQQMTFRQRLLMQRESATFSTLPGQLNWPNGWSWKQGWRSSFKIWLQNNFFQLAQLGPAGKNQINCQKPHKGRHCSFHYLFIWCPFHQLFLSSFAKPSILPAGDNV